MQSLRSLRSSACASAHTHRASAASPSHLSVCRPLGNAFAPAGCPCRGAKPGCPCSSSSSTHLAAGVSDALPVVLELARQSSPITSNTFSHVDEYDLNARHHTVLQHFPTALGVDDWMARVETVLASYGFTGDNSIAMTNLCRDEVTSILKDKIEAVFGSSFNTNGLGGVLTCGVTGMGAGLSHSPICDNGRERYVFFSFPHIAIDSLGTVGAISRPGREGRSCACGAMQKCLNEFTAEGYAVNCKVPGVHAPLDPEYSILKQRLARTLRDEAAAGASPNLTLTSITATAERTITRDLEFLIDHAVDHTKADYAVVTGVQIHNWASKLGEGAPSLEFVAPSKLFVVINGVKTHLDISRMPTLSHRQLMLMAAASMGDGYEISPSAMSKSTGSTLQEIPQDYLMKRMGFSMVDTGSSSESSWSQPDTKKAQLSLPVPEPALELQH